MKKLIILILFLFISICFAESKRIYFKPDGKIAVVTFVGDNEEPSNLKGLPYKDIDSSQLPQDRKTRDKWRWNLVDKIIYIDNSVILKREQIEAKTVELDTELAKPTPDVIKALKLYREIEILRSGK